MKFSHIFTTVTGAVLTSSGTDAFGVKLSPIDALKAVKVLRRKGDPIMFPGVHLPRSLSVQERIHNLLELQVKTNVDVFLQNFLPKVVDESEIPAPLNALDTSPDFSTLLGEPKPKKDTEPRSLAFRKIFEKLTNRAIKVDIDDPAPCEGYLYFGNQDYTKILPMLCQVNPFWANALSVAGENDEYLELKAYGSNSKTAFSAAMETMQDSNKSRFINVRFNKDMTINQVVNHESGKAVVVPEEEWNYYLTGATYNVYCYTQNVHALIHVLHYLMCTGINVSTSHDDSLNAWASIYDDNIAAKYYEVAIALFDSNLSDNDSKVLTGKEGYGTTKDVMKPLKEILCDWGSFKSADDFMKKFLLKNIYDGAKNPEEVIKAADILTEFSKHVDNIDPFATELSTAMEEEGKEAFQKAEEKLTEFMKDCGRGVSSVDSISSWVQLMCCTGIVHGSTLSHSRMCVMPEITRWRDITTPKFSEVDTALMLTIIGTLQGMTLDRHTFTGNVRARGRPFGEGDDNEWDTDFGKAWDTDSISTGTKAVLQKYDAKAEELKNKYQAEIEKKDNFREFGWILTDHCPDGYDGKQHTITTYV